MGLLGKLFLKQNKMNSFKQLGKCVYFLRKKIVCNIFKKLSSEWPIVLQYNTICSETYKGLFINDIMCLGVGGVAKIWIYMIGIGEIIR